MKIKAHRDGKEVSTITITRLKTGDIEIEYIRTDPQYRGQGLASGLLKKVIAVANKMQVHLVAYIEPDNSGGLSAEQEVQWLLKHGFAKSRYDFGGFYKPVMIYPAKGDF